MKRYDTESSSRWGGPGWLRWTSWILLAVIVVVVLADVVIERQVTWGALTRALPGLVVLSTIVLSRIETRATTEGLEVCPGLRTRRIPWSQVSDLKPDKPSRWAESIQAHLVDGSTVQLPQVPTADLPRLEQLRGRASRD